MTTDSNAHKVLFIIGPTAVGKTEISLRVAEQLDGEIVSADSRQVYKHLDIGTAKPSRADLARVLHHFIDVRSPDHYYSAGEYGREARDCIRTIQAQNKIAIVVGGSGFYIRALVDGLFAPKLSDPLVKEKWRQRIVEEGSAKVYDILAQVDPKTAARVHPNDGQRLVRALEVWELSGTPISEFQQREEQAADFVPVFVALNRDRKNLYSRIEQRVDQMIADGLVDEVRNLQKMGYGPELNALKTVGYQEVFDYFSGGLSYEIMIETIKRHTRNYAKRQLTWFQRDKRMQWITIDFEEKSRVHEIILDKYRRT